MLIKKFVPRALMQQQEKTTVIEDFCGVVGSLGYFLLNPTFTSKIANVSAERTFLHNLFYYRSCKMNFKEIRQADRLTVALQEALIQNQLFDVRGIGSKVQYSQIYGTSYSWIDIPNVNIKYKWVAKDNFDYSSCIIFKKLSSSVYSKLASHDFYVKEFSQALKKIKNCDVLAPTLDSNGFLIYPLIDNTVEDRFKFKSVLSLKQKLSNSKLKKFEIPLTTHITYDPTQYANILLAGEIGGGKSYTCIGLACEMALCGYKVSIIDGKNADLAFFGKKFLPKGHTATTGEDALRLLRHYVKLMDRTYDYMDKVRKKDPENHLMVDFSAFDLKPRMLFIDEFASILVQLSSKQAKEATALLKQLVLKNRQAGCYVCIATQQPNARVLDTDVRDNLMLRIYMGVPKVEVKNMVFGAGSILPDCEFKEKGTGFLQFAGKDEIQVYHSATLPNTQGKLYQFIKLCFANQKSMR